jgi:hypothetical protein
MYRTSERHRLRYLDLIARLLASAGNRSKIAKLLDRGIATVWGVTLRV